MKKVLLFSLVMTLSCNKEKWFDGPDFYFDDFEAYEHISDLIDGDNQRWSFFQNTYSENLIEMDTQVVYSGNKSIRFSATNSTGEKGASKASINKQFMAFWEGDVVSVSVRYYIQGNAKADWLFLFDLEEKTAIGAGPGMRLALFDGFLLVEHKYPSPDIRQPKGEEIPFPRNQWVHIRFETKLSQKKEGYVKVWQDDVLILEQYEWKTLPSDLLYALQGTKGMYSQIEFGITANTHDNPMVIYIDDVEVQKLE